MVFSIEMVLSKEVVKKIGVVVDVFDEKCGVVFKGLMIGVDVVGGFFYFYLCYIVKKYGFDVGKDM